MSDDESQTCCDTVSPMSDAFGSQVELSTFYRRNTPCPTIALNGETLFPSPQSTGWGDFDELEDDIVISPPLIDGPGGTMLFADYISSKREKNTV